MTIDDRIPCEEKLWFSAARPIMAKTIDSEAWVLLLEKAVAKLAGNYSRLNGGQCMVAWVALTGCEEQHLYKRRQDGKWEKNLLDLENKREEGLIGTDTYTLTTGTELNSEALWEFLVKCDQRNFIMGASMYDGRQEGARADGLVTGHAYSLIALKQVGEHRLAQLRNPHGKDREWNGAWSDESDEWTANPEVTEELEHSAAPDGLFWMAFEEFIAIFDTVEVCARNMRLTDGQQTKRLRSGDAKSTRRLEVAEAAQEAPSKELESLLSATLRTKSSAAAKMQDAGTEGSSSWWMALAIISICLNVLVFAAAISYGMSEQAEPAQLKSCPFWNLECNRMACSTVCLGK